MIRMLDLYYNAQSKNKQFFMKTIKTKVQLLAIACVTTLLLLTAACNKKSETAESILATTEQLQADSLSVKLLQHPEIQKLLAEVQQIFESDSISKTPEGLKAARTAALEVVFGSIQFVIANDPLNPKFLWYCHAPRSWHGLDLPGSRFGYDNPDNVYRIAYVDSASTYEIKVHRNAEAPIQESFELLDATGFNAGQLVFREGKDLEINENGDYTVTLSSNADSTNKNHFQLTKSNALILYRNTLSDWTAQLPTSIEIKRTSGNDSVKVRTEDDLAKEVVAYASRFSKLLVAFKQGWTYGKNIENKLDKPFERDGGWGYALAGYYNIAPDEAWIITLNPKGAKYNGFQLTDPWLNSLSYIKKQSSLNNSQSKADADGNVTFVISAKDPGIYNWLDNHGQAHGSLLIRWQFLPDNVKNIDDAIVYQEKVKISDLPTKLSVGIAKITPEERANVLKKRALSFENRLGIKTK